MRARRGLTLAEVLVAATLSVLALSLVLWLYVSLQKTWYRGERRQQAVRDGLIVTSRIREDFRASMPGRASLVSQNDDVILSFPSYLGSSASMWDDKGQILWRKWVHYRYQAATGSLYRQEAERTPTPDVAEANPGWVPTAPSHRLSSHVAHFRALVQDFQLQIEGRVQLETATSPLYLKVYPQLYGQDLH
jgi:type II secretory pathway component PulJ